MSPPIQSSDASNSSRRVFTTASNVDASHARSGQNSLTTKGSQHGLLMLDILHEPNDNEHSIYANQILQDDDSFQFSSTSEHLRVSEDQFRFLANEPLSTTQSETNFVSSPSNPSCGHERADRRARQSCSSEGVEKDSGSRHVHWEDQKENKSRVRYHQDYGGTCSRPSQFNRLLAMRGQTHSQSRRQQMGPMVGVRPLCTSSEIYSDQGVTSRVHSHCLAGQRDSSLEPPSFGGLHHEDCNNRLVKQTIKFITSQEAINSAKSSVNKAKLAKSKGYPKNAVEVSEIPIHSDEEDPMFEVISSEKKKSKAQESTSSET